MFPTLLLAAVMTTTSCGGSTGAQAANDTTMTDTASVRVEVETTDGNFTVLLYGDTPKHRDNFVKLVKEGFYNGTLFHRVIKDFMVQAGDPNSREAAADARLGDGDPGYTLEAEILYPKHFHKYGALAAARTGDNVNPERRSSGSQFYVVTGQKYSPEQVGQIEMQLDNAQKQSIFRGLVEQNRSRIEQMQQAQDQAGLQALQQQLIEQTEAEAAKNPAKLTEAQKQAYTTVGGTPHLDGQYTVFGEVISGMDTIEKIQNEATGTADRPVKDVRITGMKILK